MKFVLFDKEYTMEQLEEITGNKPRTEYIPKLKEIEGKKNERAMNIALNKILRKELKIEVVQSWNIDMKRVCILFGYIDKCNATVKSGEGFTGFCKNKPSFKDNNKTGEKETNGRCVHHQGKSNKRKPNGRKPNDPKMKNNKNALTTGKGIRADSKLKERLKALEGNVEETDQLVDVIYNQEDDIENIIKDYKRRITLQIEIINNMRRVGIYKLDEPVFIPKLDRFGKEIVDEETQEKELVLKDLFTMEEYNRAVDVYRGLQADLRSAIELRDVKLKQLEMKSKDKNNDNGGVVIQFPESSSKAPIEMFSVKAEFLPKETLDSEGEE